MAPTMPIPPDAEARLNMLESTVSEKKTESKGASDDGAEKKAGESL